GFAERVRVVECDLTDPGWTERVAEARESLAGERPAALLSSTALHWLSPAELAGFYAQAGELLAPGGVLLNADHMRYDRRWPGLAELSRKHRERVLQASVASGADSWEDWWQRAAQIPRLAPLKAQRDAHFARRPLRRASEDEDCSLDFHLAALRQAGFAEAATVWQQLDNYVVFARLAQA
ncbi:SAM-dependent methyltransferase, partial [Pseudomonas aeruginosa]|nr:SAM-dependent methyltransferase [Pseudomonas aeruginosa]